VALGTLFASVSGACYCDPERGCGCIDDEPEPCSVGCHQEIHEVETRVNETREADNAYFLEAMSKNSFEVSIWIILDVTLKLPIHHQELRIHCKSQKQVLSILTVLDYTQLT
jgi:hypothetical protein